MVAEAGLGRLEKAPEVENRVARMEGAYEHLATKADLEKLRADLTWRLFVGMGVYMAIIVALIVAYIEWRVVP